MGEDRGGLDVRRDGAHFECFDGKNENAASLFVRPSRLTERPFVTWSNVNEQMEVRQSRGKSAAHRADRRPPHFKAQVGASYLLAMLTGGELRACPAW